MLCPNCQIKLKEVRVNSLNPGYIISINQCSKCGGIWFDQYELYQIPLTEAKRIDQIDALLLSKPVPVKNNLICPNDKAKLKRLIDQNIPKNVQIYRCPKCAGSWLNRGELLEFQAKLDNKKVLKKFEVKTIPLRYKKQTYSEIKKFLENKYGRSKYTDGLAMMSAYFAGPIVGTGKDFFLPDKDYEEQVILTPEEREQIAMTPPSQRGELYKNFINYRLQGEEGKKRLVKSIIDGWLSVLGTIFGLFFDGYGHAARYDEELINFK